MLENDSPKRVLTAMVNEQEEPRANRLSIHNTFNLLIGSVCCALKCRDVDVYRRLKRLYHSFLTHQPVDITIELEGTDRLSPDDLNTVLSENKYVHEENQFRSSSQVVSGRYNLSHRYIKITGEKSLANPDLECNHLNQLLSLAYYSACKIKYDGHLPAMIVHACGILRSGYSLIFTGPSEAGKTTIARFCGKRDGEVINDEMLLVSRPNQHRNGISVSSAPFLGRLSSSRSIEVPLRCVLLLKKGSQTLVRAIDRTEAYLRFMRQIITPAYIGQKDKRAVLSLMSEFSDQITRAIPIYELEFNLNRESVWQVVNKLVSQ